MKYIKTYNEKIATERIEDIETKIEDVAYMLNDIFDDNNITNGNDVYEETKKEPTYPSWMFMRVGGNKDNPKDRIIINVPSFKYKSIKDKIKETQPDIENLIGYKVNIWGHCDDAMDAVDEIDLDGRILIRILWENRLDKVKSFFGTQMAISHGTNYTGPR